MTCCRCNRTGRCKNCSCSKEKRTCDSCLPGRLGNCQNYSRPNVRTANTTSVATTSTRTASSSNTPCSSSSFAPQLVPTQITSTANFYRYYDRYGSRDSAAFTSKRYTDHYFSHSFDSISQPDLQLYPICSSFNSICPSVYIH